MKLNYILLLTILLVGVVLISGCTSSESKKNATIPTPPPISTPPKNATIPTPPPISTPPSSDFYQVTFQELDLQCMGSGGTREFVAHTQTEYQHFIDISPELHPNPSLSCIEYEFPVIDFSQNTLLGRMVTGGGCTSEVKKEVLRNDYNRTVIYSINTIFTGTCAKAITDNNFILVPKIPEDYTIKFEVSLSQLIYWEKIGFLDNTINTTGGLRRTSSSLCSEPRCTLTPLRSVRGT